MFPADPALFSSAALTSVSKRLPFKVQGTGRSDKGVYVIIGGNVYREGDTKGEITVVKIGEEKVDILINGEPDSLQIR